MAPPVLWQFRFSHFNEKARWALDWQGIAHVRRALFHELLPETEFAAAAFTLGFGPGTRRLYRALFPALRVVMRADMKIDDARTARSREKVLGALDRLEAELQPSGYLVGERFSVADLTAAALLAPVVFLPPEFPYAPPGPLPAPVARWREAFAGRRASHWAAEMYRRHRGTSAEIAA